MTPGDLLPPLLRRPAARLKNALRRRLFPGRTRDLHRSGIGAGEFAAVGEELLRLAIDPGGLTPADRVLDVGCGLGRIALPLAGYLGPEARYTGFDVVEDAVFWCRRSLPDPRFEFLHLDVQSDLYNPRGRFAPEGVRFPAADASCDSALAFSLFTHLTAPAAAHYLQEIARALRPGGRLVATFFLLDAEAEAGIAAGRVAYRFAHAASAGQEPARLEDPATVETAVAYPRAWLMERLQEAGFALVGEVHRGRWSGTGNLEAAGLTFQDLIVAQRR